MKRVVDVVLSLIALLLLSPLLLAVAAAIALHDGLPVFFRQQRVGLRGREFGMFKFRSMVKNAASIGPYFTVAQDARITPVGRLIRRTSLDELPQLFNVLRGDMSLGRTAPRRSGPARATTVTRTGRSAASRAPRHHRPGAGAASLRMHPEAERWPWISVCRQTGGLRACGSI
jgi:lipopolysaccharide/colanic/teichoic acid biosynthesis glycosyltransferase